MAIRKIREVGDEVLEKQCKKVDKMTIRTKILIQDMLDTMYDAMGVGLAAPQVGILKQIVTIDVGEGPIVLINPEIIEVLIAVKNKIEQYIEINEGFSRIRIQFDFDPVQAF